MSGTRPPVPLGHKYYVLIESLGSDPGSDQERMLALLEEALSEGLVKEAVPAMGQSDLDWFWRIREEVHVLVKQCTYDQHFDISAILTRGRTALVFGG